MKNLFAAVALSLLLVSVNFAKANEINIIPRPNYVKAGEGNFTLDHKTKIVATNKEGRKSAGVLNDLLMARYGFKLEYTNKKQNNNYISFQSPSLAIQHTPGSDLSSYGLGINKDRIIIEAFEQGQFHAIQSLLQLLPTEFKGKAEIPAMEVQDSPRFRYRGMHLDVSRHFMPIEFVKKYIDLMSQYKFNTFHWHLTDDQGWRIEIKKYPKLTEIGSKRPETMVARNFSPYIGDGIPVEGFYTQKQIREVVAYAKARYITLIPEIELPGHASAALAAYPELGCKTDYKYKVQTTWGIFKEVFCPTDTTFKFLEDVIDETIKLFPDSPYIHIGGDEVLKDHWKESPFVQELMKRENLKDEHEVQSYFIRRIEKFINSKGKKIIGWDEILEGGVAPNATIMSWRGEKGGIEAANAHHDVIMTPNTYVYFDYGQGDPAYEPLNIGSYIPLSKVYGWDPVPKELAPDEVKYILGGQANIWTEYLKKPENVEYMAFPRMLALSEVLWTQPANKNYADFKRRLVASLPRLDAEHVNYRIPEPGGLENIVTAEKSVSVTLTPAPGTKVYYTTDGSAPTRNSAVYSDPVKIELKDEEPVTLKTIVVNAAGRESSIYAATIVRGTLASPAEVGKAAKPGVSYDFFIPRGDMSGEGEHRTGETRSIMLNQFAKTFDLTKPFAVTFDGYLNIPEDGVYELLIDSTWDATLVFDEKKVIDEAGTKNSSIKSAIVPLKAGPHKISLRYNHRGGDAYFRFRYGIKGRGLNQAYGGEFVH
ncbi:MAG: family 20 glycosylhydrolase [Chloracidobacterium sp.]|nr:family 20 glycosylhydrolase [Chloracidobacterium sp.]